MTIMSVLNQNNKFFHTNIEDCLPLQSDCNGSIEILHLMKSTKIIKILRYKYILYDWTPSC